uniref:bifunctional serine/threonine-protein kinase/formylglycine-generating enzyme family protein n=1 Tax=Geitlerinema sp. PCC 9228 TaxID=111611 RepID=UPI0008F9BAF0
GKLILVDFGAAKQVANSALSVTGTTIGSPGYTAPEQAEGKAQPNSDIYSLGVTCVRLLTQVEPFYFFDVMEDKWIWRDYLNAPIDKKLDAILDKMLIKATKRRYQSATEVLQDLQPTKAQPSPTSSSKAKQPSSATSSTPTSSQKSFKSKQKPSLRSFEFETATVEVAGNDIQIHRHRQQAWFFSEVLGNNIELEMVYIPSGTFTMGAPESEERNYDDERPQHQVSVPAFFLGKYPVTQAQWRAVANLPKYERDLEPNPSGFSGDNRPVERVSWYDAVEFCQRLSQHTGREYRLPSEAEWEYACRAGTQTPFYFGETITTELANYDGNYVYGRGKKGEYRRETTDVGSFPANGFGLFDMHGNVWEWCADDDHNNYEGAPTDGSAWIDNEDRTKADKLLRGGSWDDFPHFCRSAVRFRRHPGDPFHDIGFRVACASARTL